MSVAIPSALSAADKRIQDARSKQKATRTPPQAMSTRRNQSARTPGPKPKTRPVNKRETSNHLRRSNNGKRFPERGQKIFSLANRLGLKNNNPTLRRSNLNPGNTKVRVVRGLFGQVKKLFPGSRRGNQNSRQVSNNRTVTPTYSLLGDFTPVQLRMFYVNTYNTLAYFSGQYVNEIDDGEVLRYMIFLELVINKLNKKSLARERELSELWNKSLEMRTFRINHDKILTRYRNIMESGFKSNGGNMSSILNNAKK